MVATVRHLTGSQGEAQGPQGTQGIIVRLTPAQCKESLSDNSIVRIKCVFFHKSEKTPLPGSFQEDAKKLPLGYVLYRGIPAFCRTLN